MERFGGTTDRVKNIAGGNAAASTRKKTRTGGEIWKRLATTVGLGTRRPLVRICPIGRRRVLAS